MTLHHIASLLYRTLLPVLVVLMPAPYNPNATACRLTQRAALCNSCQLLAVPNNLPEHIQDLHLNQNSILKLQDGDFSRYPLLLSLSCASNHLQLVEHKTFSSSPLIESVNFADNELHHGHEQLGQSLRLLVKLRTLDISNNGLTEDMASDLLKNLTSLEYLYMSRNLLLRLDETTLSDLHQLKELNLEKNLLFEIDGAFDHLNKLQRLNLAFNQLPCLMNFDMTQLVVLNASHNAIEWFISNQYMADTFQLQTLDLSDNNLYFFPFLPIHNHIQTLLLSQNQIRFYEHLSNWSAPNWTTSVDFYNLRVNVSNITANLWDEDIYGEVSSVQLLDMSGNKVDYFPRGFIKNMSHLYWLKLRTNCFVSFNMSAGELPVALYELDVSNNRLNEIQTDQNSAMELNNLTHLNLSLNDIHQLPAKLFVNLPSLSTADLSYNPVGVCHPGEYGGARLSNCAIWANIMSLRQLHLAGCNLVQLPPSAFDGTPLTHLELSNNPALHLWPKSLAGLSGTLQHLGLENINLKNFDFSPFQHLLTVIISQNSLSYLPESLISLNLRVLDLRNNKLSTIPPEHARVLAQRLHTLFISGNNFNCCLSDWYRTFQRAKTVHIKDLSEVTCLDLRHKKHSFELFNSDICGQGLNESIWWYLLLFLSIGLSVVGIAIIYLLTFRPRLLPKAIKKKFRRSTSY